MFRRLNARILIALLGLVVSNVAVARKSQPVSPEILEATTMRFWVDSTEFVVPYELLKDAAEDKTLNSDDFVQKYYEPLRAALPKYVSRTSCAGTCTPASGPTSTFRAPPLSTARASSAQAVLPSRLHVPLSYISTTSWHKWNTDNFALGRISPNFFHCHHKGG